MMLIVILLVPTIQCYIPEFEFTRDACLQSVNSARAAFAEKFQVPNMNSLVYNEEFEKTLGDHLGSMVKCSGDKEEYPEYMERCLEAQDDCPEPSIISLKGLEMYLSAAQDEAVYAELVSAEDATMLACVKRHCDAGDIVHYVTDKAKKYHTPIIGPPGSKCPSDRVADSNGLCVLVK
ncbi:hypothetical protein CAEBREN_06494 [Caenorhabditis brenneri]|uniref:Uncharacterized protein n=1 Tax=Caenorhabditis brenneri TaxID=135651 RepID=G0MD37_CAEBE|nr:hypothetical protein CAEBREN_06494 [Caenorhabditis brenneri]